MHGFIKLINIYAEAFIQNDLECIQVIHFLSVRVFPGNRTHNFFCAANAMLYHWATGTPVVGNNFQLPTNSYTIARYYAR